MLLLVLEFCAYHSSKFFQTCYNILLHKWRMWYFPST